MDFFNKWLTLNCLFSVFFYSSIESIPSLLSHVKAQHRMQFASSAEQYNPNWASSQFNQYSQYPTAWSQIPNQYSPYVQSIYPYSNYAPSYSQPDQGFMLAPPPPEISPIALDKTKNLNGKYKTEALRRVSPQVKRFLNANPDQQNHFQMQFQHQHQHQMNPLLMRKKMENAERLHPLSGGLRPLSAKRLGLRNRGLGHHKDITNIFANDTNSNLNNNSKANNKTGFNLHRFRPNRWTNVFSRASRRQQFQLNSESSNQTFTNQLDDNLAQNELTKLNTNNTFNTATNSTKGRLVPGPKRRYGYKNFRLIQSNSTDDSSNSTQLRSDNEFQFRRNYRNNNNSNEFGSNSTETGRRPFGNRLFGKKLFKSYIEKQKLVQLLRNETDLEETTQTTDLSSDLVETTVDTPLFTTLTNLLFNN